MKTNKKLSTQLLWKLSLLMWNYPSRYPAGYSTLIFPQRSMKTRSQHSFGKCKVWINIDHYQHTLFFFFFLLKICIHIFASTFHIYYIICSIKIILHHLIQSDDNINIKIKQPPILWISWLISIIPGSL